MRTTKLPHKASRSEIVAYGCVGSAIAFIMALTFGLFESPDHPRYLAANHTVPEVTSTP